jgi:putative tryptophan/tyrosine transport system substrate-binding protein
MSGRDTLLIIPLGRAFLPRMIPSGITNCMKRRQFITLLGGAAAAWPLAVHAQGEPVRRVGSLLGGDEGDPVAKERFSVFTRSLSGLGWIDGRNLRLDARWGAGDAERMRRFAKELVDLRPDVIFCATPATTKAMQRETQSIPIIFSGVGDPTASGLLQNVAKPEGNTTGATNYLPSFGGKWLELLKEAVPRLSRVALIFNPDISTGAYFGSLDAAASQLSLPLTRMPYRDAADLVRSIDAFGRQPNGALFVLPPPPIGSNRALITGWRSSTRFLSWRERGHTPRRAPSCRTARTSVTSIEPPPRMWIASFTAPR